MITFTQGDTAVINLTATDGNGNPINIAGASFSTQILGSDGVSVAFPNGQHSITNAVLGQFTLSLASADTSSCGVGMNKTILTTISQGGTIISYRGNALLNVLVPVPQR